MGRRRRRLEAISLCQKSFENTPYIEDCGALITVLEAQSAALQLEPGFLTKFFKRDSCILQTILEVVEPICMAMKTSETIVLTKSSVPVFLQMFAGWFPLPYSLSLCRLAVGTYWLCV